MLRRFGFLYVEVKRRKTVDEATRLFHCAFPGPIDRDNDDDENGCGDEEDKDAGAVAPLGLTLMRRAVLAARKQASKQASGKASGNNQPFTNEKRPYRAI